MSHRWTAADFAALQRKIDARPPRELRPIPAIMRPSQARELSLWLPWPPSVNRLYRNDENHGRRLRDEQVRYRAHIQAEILAAGSPRIDGRLDMTAVLFSPTRARYDLDNRAKAILDALEAAGVIPNDEAIDRLELVRGERGADHGPGAAVTLRRMTEER